MGRKNNKKNKPLGDARNRSPGQEQTAGKDVTNSDKKGETQVDPQLQPPEPTNTSGRSSSARSSSTRGRANMPGMPSRAAVKDARQGGLGRGLGALIPTGPARPSLGSSAADVILGARRSAGEDESATGDPQGSRRGPRAQTDDRGKAGDVGADSRVTTNAGGFDERFPGGAKDNVEGSHHVDDVAPTKSQERGQGTPRGAVASTNPGDRSNANRSEIPRGSDTDSERTDSRRHSDVSNPTGYMGQSADLEASKSRQLVDGGAVYREIPIDDIRANAKQPRHVFAEEELTELKESIREFGLMQPIVVRYAPQGETNYELIMGERRLRASKAAGVDEIPAIVRQTDDDDMLRDALLENLHRVQLNPLEEAAAFQQLLEEFGVTQQQLADRIKVSRPRVTNTLRLLQLPVSVQTRVAAGVISSSHARVLVGVADPVDMEHLANRIVQEGLSVRSTEEAALLLRRKQGGKRSASSRQGQRPPLPETVRHWAENISDALETKVSVQMGKKKGKIVVEFGGPDDFERIVELLKFSREDS